MHLIAEIVTAAPRALWDAVHAAVTAVPYTVSVLVLMLAVAVAVDGKAFAARVTAAKNFLVALPGKVFSFLTSRNGR